MIKTKKSKILIADDNQEIARILKTMLTRAGHKVTVVYDGEEAVKQVKKRAFDLILLDVKMPKLNGYEACETIKSNKTTKFTPVIMITGLNEVEDKIKSIKAGADDFLNKPVNMSELVARAKSLIRLKHTIDHLENTENVLFALAEAVEAKDSYTNAHLRRMAGHSLKLTRRIGLLHETEIALKHAAILHDIGKIGINENILSKRGRLTGEEFEEIKKHAVIGEKIVKPLRFSNIIAPAVRGHHERWDGNGYPDGLAGKAIPIGARIISIADAYDTMTSDRPYRKHMSKKMAIDILQEGKGTQWDAGLVDIFIDSLR